MGAIHIGEDIRRISETIEISASNLYIDQWTPIDHRILRCNFSIHIIPMRSNPEAFDLHRTRRLELVDQVAAEDNNRDGQRTRKTG